VAKEVDPTDGFIMAQYLDQAALLTTPGPKEAVVTHPDAGLEAAAVGSILFVAVV